MTVVVTPGDENFSQSSQSSQRESGFFAELVSASVPAGVAAFSDKKERTHDAL
jgi:hypothetical protein